MDSCAASYIQLLGKVTKVFHDGTQWRGTLVFERQGKQVSGQLPEDGEGSPKAYLTGCSAIFCGTYTRNVQLQIMLSSTRSRMLPVTQ